jgi:hypothetical protein
VIKEDVIMNTRVTYLTNFICVLKYVDENMVINMVIRMIEVK